MNRIPMKKLARIALISSVTTILICLLGYICFLSYRLRPPRKITQQMLHERLVRRAGEGAKDCGFATSDEEDNAENRCALQALRGRQPFLVQYRRVGIDSVLQRGFALNSKGQLFMVDGFWRSSPDEKAGDLFYGKCPNIPEVTSMGKLYCEYSD
jgi:hypothetical protein